MVELGMRRLAILILVGGCSHQTHVTRSPASLGELPVVPAAAFLDPIGIKEIFSQMQGATAGSQLFNEKDLVYPDPPHFDDLNQIFQKTVARTKALLGSNHAPDPILVIVPNAEPNAFVTSLPVNVGPVNFLGTEMDAVSIFSENEANKGLYLAQGLPSAHLLASSEKKWQVWQYVSGQPLRYPRGSGECTSQIQTQNAEVTCSTQKRYELKVATVHLTAPFVFVHAGIVAKLTNADQLEAIFAHELAHYYLAHTATIIPQPSYFYSSAKHKLPIRPPREPSLDKLGKTMGWLGNVKDGRTLPEYFSHPLTGETALSIGLSIINSDLPGYEFDHLACTGLDPKRDGAILEEFLFSKVLTKDSEDKSRQIFARLKSCLSTARLVRGKNHALRFVGGGASIAIYQHYLNSPTWPESDNAWEGFLQFDKTITEGLRQIQSEPMLKNLRSYTIEEEADSFAIKYLLANGKSPEALISALRGMVEDLAMNPLMVKIAKNRDLNKLRDCFVASRNNWRLGNEEYRPSPVDYSQSHSDICFRLYNVSVLAGLHGVKSNESATLPDVPAQKFAQIQRDYKVLRRSLIHTSLQRKLRAFGARLNQ